MRRFAAELGFVSSWWAHGFGSLELRAQGARQRPSWSFLARFALAREASRMTRRSTFLGHRSSGSRSASGLGLRDHGSRGPFLCRPALQAVVGATPSRISLDQECPHSLPSQKRGPRAGHRPRPRPWTVELVRPRRGPRSSLECGPRSVERSPPWGDEQLGRLPQLRWSVDRAVRVSMSSCQPCRSPFFCPDARLASTRVGRRVAPARRSSRREITPIADLADLFSSAGR